MGSKKNATTTPKEDIIKIVAETPEVESQVSEGEVTETAAPAEEGEVKTKKKTKAQARSARYHAVRAQVDKTKAYDPFAAIELVKKLSYSKFAGSLTADLIVKEEGMQVSVAFPHSTGKSLTVAIVNDQVLKDIEAGTINFDVLITEPRFMPQLAKFAKVLGPKGLMPNPKNGTVTANPELKKQELEGGKVTVKAEKKAPLMHVSIGKTDMETKALLENLQALMNALNGKIVKLNVSATMSPGVRVMVE